MSPEYARDIVASVQEQAALLHTPNCRLVVLEASRARGITLC